MKKNEIILAFISGLISIMFTAIYDWAKEKPIFSTFIDIIKWIWKNLFEFELKIWQILLLIFGFTMIKRITKILSKKNTPINNENDWLNYTEDFIEGLRWRWKWHRNPLNHNWNVNNISIACHNCGTSMNMDTSYVENFAECPRCDKTITGFKNIDKIEAIIIDNVQRGLYKNRMIDSNIL